MSEAHAREKMANVAREILAGQIGLLEGTRQLADLSRSLSDAEATDPDVLTLIGVDSELDDIPFGSARDRWAPEALAEKDRQCDEYIQRARVAIESAYLAIVNRSRHWCTNRAAGRVAYLALCWEPVRPRWPGELATGNLRLAANPEIRRHLDREAFDRKGRALTRGR